MVPEKREPGVEHETVLESMGIGAAPIFIQNFNLVKVIWVQRMLLYLEPAFEKSQRFLF